IMQLSCHIFFPYTTLFRSFWNFEGDFAETSLYHHSSVASIYPKLAFQYIPGMMIMENGERNKLFVSGIQSQTNAFYQLSSNQKVDRKSTRLNSSHVKISYA